MRRSAVVEHGQWVDVYTLPNGKVHIVYLAPYKLPTQYQSKLALKRAGIELPQPPPLCPVTEEERCEVLSEICNDAMDGKYLKSPGMPERYKQFDRWVTLYWHKQYRIEGPNLNARQKFEQHLFENRFNNPGDV